MKAARKHGQGNIFSRPTLKHWYLQFYRDGKQHNVNTKILRIGATDAETTANRAEAQKRLDQEIAKRTLEQKSNAISGNAITYEDMRDLLVQKYKDNMKASLYVGADGINKLVGSKGLDEYFGGMTLKKMAEKLNKYPSWYRERPEVKQRWADYVEKRTTKLKYVDQLSRKYAVESAQIWATKAVNATINRSLSTLRSMYSKYAEAHSDQLGKSDIPTMPRIETDASDNVGQGFVEPEKFETILAALPEHLRPIIQFQYLTGMRSGAANSITWGMVSDDTKEIVIPAGLMKNKDPWKIPLVGPLEPIAETLKKSKGLRAVDMPVFNTTNLRRIWNQTCAKLGLGVFDPKTQQYDGLHPHDLRRSAARNLVRAGVSKTVAQKITGHKSSRMFDRYDITDSTDVVQALTAVGDYNTARVAESKAAKK
jgi:integrase